MREQQSTAPLPTIFTWDSLCPTTGVNLPRVKNIRNPAIRELLKSGLDPKFFPSEKLFYWLARARHPILSSDDPLTKMFIEAMLTGESVEFIYVGGSKPGSPRKVNVSLVFHHESAGRIYVAGYCPERASNRVFALDLIMVIHAWN
jgi:hypothetical protein